MNLLRVLLRMSPALVALALVASALSGLSQAGLLVVINQGLNVEADREALVPRFLALMLLLPVLRVGSAYVVGQLGQRAGLHLRMRLAGQILRAPLRRIEEAGAPRLFATLSQDTASIVGALTTLPALLSSAAIVAGGLAYMIWLSWEMFLVFLVVLVIGVVSYYVPFRAAARMQERSRELVDRLWEHFRALTEGVKEMKLHGPRQGAYMGELEETGVRLRTLRVRAGVIFDAAGSWAQVMIFAVIGTMIFLVPTGAVEMATLTGYVLVVLYIVGPIEFMMASSGIFNQATIAVGKVEDLGLSLEAETPPRSPAQPLPSGRDWNALELRGVTHAYRGERGETFQMGPLDLRIEQGEVLFIVGGNGSGKTTLVKVLTGLYPPEAGEVRFAGTEVTDGNRDEYLNRFSVVFSEFFLFATLLGISTAEDLDAEAERYVKKLELDGKVTIEEGRFSTTDLSRGQRKRLALLTACLEDREIYVFDEWAADQDPHFKRVFYRELVPELRARGKTVVIVSHDDHFFDVADRIIKLDSGQLDDDAAVAAMALFGVGTQGTSSAPAS
jgi:putative pyoverdin transport system ATP-binding/permease protein